MSQKDLPLLFYTDVDYTHQVSVQRAGPLIGNVYYPPVNPAGIWRHLFTFAIGTDATIPAGATVTAVSLVIENLHGSGGSRVWQFGAYDANLGANPATDPPISQGERSWITTHAWNTYTFSGVFNAGPVVIDLGATAISDLNAALASGRQFFPCVCKNQSEAGQNIYGGWYRDDQQQPGALLRVTYNAPPRAPTTVYPSVPSVGEDVVATTTPTFLGAYSHPDASPGDKYRVQVLSRAGAILTDSGEISQTLNEGDRFTWKCDITLTAGTYYQWRACAHSTSGWSSWAESDLFTPNIGPDTPSKQVPGNGEHASGTTPTLSWDYYHEEGLPESDFYLDIHQVSNDAQIHEKYNALIWDDFNRANGALGNAIVGGAWSTTGVAPTIDTNQMYGNGIGGAVIDTGSPHGRVFARVQPLVALVFRYNISSDYYYLIVIPGTPPTVRFIQHIGTQNTLLWYGPAPVDDAGYTRLEARCTEAGIKGYADDHLLFDMGIGVGVNRTKWGVIGSAVGAWADDFAVTPEGVETVTEYTVPGGLLSLGTEYKWQIKVRDGDIWSPLSPWSVFTPSTPPTVAITNPTDGGNIGVANPTLTWDYTAGDTTQARYRVDLYHDGGLIYSSGIVLSAAEQHQLPSGYLVNTEDYTLTVTVWDQDGLSGSDEHDFHVAWTPPDAIASWGTITIAPDTAASAPCSISLAWAEGNIDPADFLCYFLYRKGPDDATPVLVATVTDQDAPQGFDYYPPLNVPVVYSVTQVKQYADEYLESAPLTTTQTITSRQTIISDVSDPADMFARFQYNPEKGVQYVEDAVDVQYWGRTKPVRHYGTLRYAKGALRAFFDDAGEIIRLNALRESKNIKALRDTRGRRFWVVLNPFTVSDEHPNAYTVSVDWVETEYTEA